MVIRGLLLVLSVIVAGCAGGGSAGATPAPTAAPASAGASAAATSAPAAEAPIVNHGPAAWSRGPYELGGGNYRLDWETDGNCSALYFGIVGVNNGYRETPPTAGDVAVKDMLKGNRTITGVPAGSYYFNVSNVACRSYTASLTRVP